MSTTPSDRKLPDRMRAFRSIHMTPRLRNGFGCRLGGSIGGGLLGNSSIDHVYLKVTLNVLRDELGICR